MNEFKGIFKDELNNFVNFKKTNGFYYNQSIIYKLKSFDKYTIKIGLKEKKLNKEIVLNFINCYNDKKSSTRSNYISVIRQFSIYLNNINISAFTIPEKYYGEKRNFKPYIYSKDEIKKIFIAINECYLKKYPKKQEQIKLIFLLLVKTGMRINEVLLIKRNNVDYMDKTILIENTKNGCDRLIIVNEEMINKLYEYEKKYNNKYEYFFENGYKKVYSVGCIYSIFRKLLFKAKIMHLESGPRIHDFRHTFCVNSFKQAIDNGLDLNYFFPVLSAYVGHKDLTSTYKYLHLTCEIFDDIRNKLNTINNIEKEIYYEEL